MQEKCHIDKLRGPIPSALDSLLLLLDIAAEAELYSEVPTVGNMRGSATVYII